MRSLRVLLGHMSGHRTLFSLFLLGLLLEVAYGIAAPISLKYMIDEAFTPRNVQAFFLILGALVIGGLLGVVGGAGGDYALSRLSGKVAQKLRTQLYDHLQMMSFPFYQKYRVGDLVTRISADMASIERVISAALPFGLKRRALAVLLGLTMLVSLNWKLTLAMSAGSVLMFARSPLASKAGRGGESALQSGAGALLEPH